MKGVRGAAILAVATLALILVGCGGGGEAHGGSTTPAATMAPPFDPGAALFTLTDMPTGWVKEREGSGADVVCRTRLFDSALDDAKVSFSEQGSLPQLNQHVGAYAPGAAAAAMADTRKVFNACTTYSDDGLTWTIAPASFPSMGDESFTYLATTETRGLRVAAVFNVMRLGDGVAAVVYGGFGDVDTSAAEDYSRRALGRLRGVEG